MKLNILGVEEELTWLDYVGIAALVATLILGALAFGRSASGLGRPIP